MSVKAPLTGEGACWTREERVQAMLHATSGQSSETTEKVVTNFRGSSKEKGEGEKT